MAGLFGMYTHTLDQRNRLFVPSKMREILGDSFVLYFPQNGDKCIYGYAHEDWQTAMDKFNEQAPSRELALRQRFIYKNTDSADVDKQGRFTVPTAFMEKAGFEKEVIVLGVGRRVEFWNPDEWAKMEAQYEEDTKDRSFELAF